MPDTIIRPRVADGHALLDFLHERAAAHAPAGARDVLDAGAGDGRLLRRVPGTRKIALDLVPLAGQVAGDVSRLPLRDSSFDVVLCINVLTGLPYATLRAGIAEMIRVLRPGGTFIAAAPNLDHPLIRLRAVLWKRRHRSTTPLAVTGSWMKRALAQAGADLQTVDWILPHSLSANAMWRNLAEGYAALAERIPRLSPHAIFVARRRPPGRAR